MDNFKNLSNKHKLALNWFLDKTGAVSGWPDNLPDGTLLVTKAKGIYKPQWSEYALSIRQNLNSPYNDTDIEKTPDGRWLYKYCPELTEGKDLNEHYTNRALLKNMQDRVPIGVLVQLQSKPNSSYKVLGLGLVKEWQGSVFVIEQLEHNERMNFFTPIDKEVLDESFDDQLAESLQISQAKRMERISSISVTPEKVKIVSSVYTRNSDITAEVLFRANGICERCKLPAPFSRAKDGSPYLEIHHVKPLSEAGKDSLDNTVALCPNCHRELHYGIV